MNGLTAVRFRRPRNLITACTGILPFHATEVRFTENKL